MHTLSDLCIQSNRQPIQKDGLTIHPSFSIDIETATVCAFSLDVSAPQPQGFVVGVEHGRLEVERLEDHRKVVTLWSDTVDWDVRVRVVPSKRGPCRLRFSHRWKIGGIAEYGLGNYGMLVQHSPDSGSWTGRCSDGDGDANFDDLIVIARMAEDHSGSLAASS